MDNNSIFEQLRKRIPMDETVFSSDKEYLDTLHEILEDSKYLALSTLFPFEDFSTMEVPKKYNNWLLRCCVELYNLADKQGIKSYSENGISWTKDTDSISLQLINELVPKAGIPKRKTNGSDINV